MFPSPVSLLWEASAFYVFIIIWSMPICSCQLDIPFILSVQNQRWAGSFKSACVQRAESVTVRCRSTVDHYPPLATLIPRIALPDRP